MKHLLLTTIAAVVLTGCSKSPEEKMYILLEASANGQTEVVRKILKEGKHSDYGGGAFVEAMRVSIDNKNFVITELIINEVPRFSSGANALAYYLRRPKNDISESREKYFLIKLIELVKLHYPPKKSTAQFFAPLFTPAKSPKLELAEFLISEGIKLHTADITYYLREFYMVNEVLEFLLEHGADINYEFEDGSTILDVAIRENSPSIEFIKGKGGKANSDKSVFLAVKYFNKPALLELLNDSKNINYKDAGGNTLLHIGVGLGDDLLHRYDNPLYKEFIELLLDKGADPFRKNNEGFTPIFLTEKDPMFLGMLPHNDLKVFKIIKEILQEPRLNRAVRMKNVELVKKCLAEKDSLESRGTLHFRNATPLYYAAYNVDPVITKLLLENGAEVNALDYQGETPLHTAVYHTFPYAEEDGIKVINLLIENGAELNVVKNIPRKMTPLDFAKDPSGKVADLLRKHGGKTAEELKAEDIEP